MSELHTGVNSHIYTLESIILDQNHKSIKNNLH